MSFVDDAQFVEGLIEKWQKEWAKAEAVLIITKQSFL